MNDSPTPGPEKTVVDNSLARRAIGLIDLTDLANDHSGDGIDRLCSRAREHKTAAVCVWPEFVARCVASLAGSAVRVATVVNFPTGEEPVAEVLATTGAALDAGADDIDLVLPYRAFLDGDVAYAGQLISDVAALIETPRILKVILETGELGDPESVARAASLAIENGADFVKTSTGKTSSGASREAVMAMLGAIVEARDNGRSVGLKPSGGIGNYEDAAEYISIADSIMGDGWATPVTFRFGASSLLDALLDAIDGVEQKPVDKPDGY